MQDELSFKDPYKRQTITLKTVPCRGVVAAPALDCWWVRSASVNALG
jgi:hypothetical protein